MSRFGLCQLDALNPHGVLLVGLFGPVDIVDPPAAFEADQSESRAVFFFIGAAKMDLERHDWTGESWLSHAQHFRVKHPPVRDDQFVPHVEGNLLAIPRGEHIVCGTELTLIEGPKLGAHDFLGAV